VVPGIAIGPLWLFSSALPPVPQTVTADPAAEAARLQQAIDAAVAGIGAGVAEGILLVHRALLRDPAIFDSALALITGQRYSAPTAWATAIAETAR
jgi:phosphoenolpyruvate-protein kinase (PTS system EI component)